MLAHHPLPSLLAVALGFAAAASGTSPGGPPTTLPQPATLSAPPRALTTADDDDDGDARVQARLVAAAADVVPGMALQVGLRLELTPQWHLYWKNPGDSGMPPRVAWELPPGVRVEGPVWPYPRRFVLGPLVSLGYADAVTLGFTVHVPEAFAGDSLGLVGQVSWLACHDEQGCIPGSRQVRWSAPVRRDGAPPPQAPLPPELAEFEARRPRTDHGWSVAAATARAPGSAAKGAEFALLLTPPAAHPANERPYDFFPEEEGRFALASPPRFEREGSAWRMHLTLERGQTPPASVTGVLLVGHGPSGPPTRALAIDTNTPAPPRPSEEAGNGPPRHDEPR
jgi:DsbC/DsbD-like thiol-disulfide interchange protein